MQTYFPGLDAIRFFAALVVIVFHGQWLFPSLPILNGGNAVTLFFTLSGFLITYLMIQERAKTNRINVRAFYVRRSLRIMPLYFLVVAISVAFPETRPDPAVTLAVLLFLMPFAAEIGNAKGVAHTWSISVEEFFYLIYPFLVSRFGVISICTAIVIICNLFSSSIPALGAYRIDTMAIGGIAAWLIVYRKQSLPYLLSAAAGWSCAILTLALMISDVRPTPSIMAVVFAVFIANVAFTRRFSFLEGRRMTWLGQRSYGVYMWHYPILIYIMFNGTVTIIPGFIAIFFGPFILAALTYRFYEAPFLRLKSRFSPVVSNRK